MGLLNRLNSLFPGRRLDVSSRFEILREAVSGSMSYFYKVRDRHLGKVVGLKILDSDKHALFEARFRGLNKPSEGEIACALRHPFIIETYEYGRTTKDEHYLIMEYLSGPSLNLLILERSQQLNGNRVVLLRQIAEALKVVHEAGYIHRDICPRNVICSDDCRSLKLIDFGLTVPAQKEYMQPGNRTGTVNYMAPEVVRRRHTDQRLDIFSFGVTAYQLCAFELPWPSRDRTGQAAVLHDTLEPIDVVAFQPRLNEKLAQLIMRCLAADPNDRPATAAGIVRRLKDIPGEFEK